jgi:hypothetical protein
VTKALKRILTLRYLISVALMIWCAGAGCMVVSYARGAMAHSDSEVASTDQMIARMPGSMDSHGCCKAKHKALRRTRIAKSANTEVTEFTIPMPLAGNAMSCCPLTSGSLVVASRPQTDDSSSDLRPSDSFSLGPVNSHEISLVVPLRLPNRAHSYLLDCAFLI